jgi:metallophosphoesterase superfamily enzyme
MQCTETLRPPRLEIRPDVWLDARLALWIASERILVVADLHWGYVESHRAQGNLLPAWGDGEIATRLRALIDDYQPAEMIWLGDSLHTLDGVGAANLFLRDAGVPVTIVSGNHDSKWSRAAGCHSVVRAKHFFHHGDRVQRVPEGLTEVIGHHHPAMLLHDGAGTRLKLPALVANERRLILPAFSPWAAGAPWRCESQDEVLYGIGAKRIFTLPCARPHNVA